MGRPALGTLKLDQKVMVRRSSNDSRRRKPEDCVIPAKVVKLGRVWVTLETADYVPSQLGHRTWRMRMDVQNEASQYSGSDASFATIEQHEWDETQRWGRGLLDDQGIRLDFGSPWRGREAELADLIVREMSREIGA